MSERHGPIDLGLEGMARGSGMKDSGPITEG